MQQLAERKPSVWAGGGTSSKSPVPAAQLSCTEKHQPQRGCSSWTPAVPSPGTPWPRCFYLCTKITSCRSCTPVKTMFSISHYTSMHQCICFPGFCMEGRGALQSSCWLHLQLVKIRDSQMVSHQLFCSWPHEGSWGRQMLPPHSSQRTAQKKRELHRAELQLIIWKKKEK